MRYQHTTWRRGAALLAMSTVLVTASSVAQADVIYVRADAEPGGNGRSWQTAFDALTDALETARRNDEIWVAGGVYAPAAPGGSRHATFRLKDRIGIYGGFLGTESQRDQRDPDANVSVLTGDLNADDEANFGNRSDNSYHVVTADACGARTVLSGFTITAGFADGSVPDGRGAGLLLTGGVPVIHACNFVDNYAVDAGAGVYNSGSSAELRDCRFEFNEAAIGAGIVTVDDARPTIINGLFQSNDALHGAGAVNWGEQVAPVFENCTFVENAAHQGWGGGMLNAAHSSPQLRGCIFTANYAEQNGGGMANVASSRPTLQDCEFSENIVAFSQSPTGGGMFNTDESIATIVGGLFTRHSSGAILNDYGRVFMTGATLADNERQAIYTDNGYVTLDGCTLVDNEGSAILAQDAMVEATSSVLSRNERAVSLTDSTSFLTDCRINGNGSLNRSRDGGAITALRSYLALRQCVLVDNAIPGQSCFGGAVAVNRTTLAATGCTFANNQAGTAGGAIFAEADSGVTLVNCLVARNQAATDGGGIWSASAVVTLTNGTVVSNFANNGGGLRVRGNTTTISGTVLWDNRGSGTLEANQITVVSEGAVDINYSCVQGWTGNYGGTGNTGAFPAFRNLSGGDYHLQPGSPLIDAGDNSAVPQNTLFDLDGNDRFVDDPDTPDTGRGEPPIVDMGAYEFQACTGLERLTVRCKPGNGGRVLVARYGGGREHVIVTLRLDDEPSRDVQVTTDAKGRARAKFRRVGPGEHTVRTLQCGAEAVVECE